MQIKKTYINSFGKYQNKELELGDGINLIYGPNEAGKSTFHKFIEGMFYGFYKSHTKNKQYEEDYDRYLPWENSNQYTGILIYEHEGREYRIERNFMKRRDRVEIYDNVTGENLTETFDYDKVTKLYQPAWKHLGINKSTFKNTISIGQLSSKTGEELAKEVKDRLINLGESHDEEISVKNVVDKLDGKLSDIGTANRKKTSPYGKMVVHLKSLQDEKTDAEKIWQQAGEEQEQLILSREKLGELEKQKLENEEKLTLINHEKIQKQYQEARAIEEALAQNRKQLDAYSVYNQIQEQDIDRALKAIHTLQANRKRQEEMIVEGESIQEEWKAIEKVYEPLKILEDKDQSQLDDLEDILSTYHLYTSHVQQMESVTRELDTNKLSSIEATDVSSIGEDILRYESLQQGQGEDRSRTYHELAIEEERLEDHTRRINRRKVNGIIYIVAVIAVMGLCLALKQYALLLALMVPNIIGGILLLVGYKKELAKASDALHKMETLQGNMDQQEKVLQEIQDQQDHILMKHGCMNLEAMRQLKEQLTYKKMHYEHEKKRYQDLQEKTQRLEGVIAEQEKQLRYWTLELLGEEHISLEGTQRARGYLDQYRQHHETVETWQKQYKKHRMKYQELEDDIQKLEKTIRDIGETYEATTEEAFAHVKANKNKYNKIYQEMKHQEAMYHQLLGATTLDELGATLVRYQETSQGIQETQEELEEAQKIVMESILDVTKEMSSHENKIINLTKNTRPLVDIEEEIDELHLKRKGYDKKIKALTMAKDVIENISRDIQNNFAPKLNEKVSHIISHITGQKYQDIKINPNMDIMTYEPQLLQLTAIDQLSKGTIDQMYFGLRLSIVDVIQEEITLPLILDDCFTQYDEERLENALEVLARLDRQVIILTCHEREGRLLDKLNIGYRNIEL